VANTRSSKKRLRQTATRTVRNRMQRSALRRALRKVRAATSAADARAALRQAERLLDRAARKRLIHPNTAARNKTRLHKLIGQKS
jgi:small subunit ribosomal protein S20